MLGKQIEILLVEDNIGDVVLTQEAFSDLKMANTLHVVSDGEKALEFLRKEGDYKGATCPDLILLDLNVPKLNGREVLQSIKEDSNLSTIPVVVLSGSKSEADIAAAYGLDAHHYLVKPISAKSLIAVVNSIDHFGFAMIELSQKQLVD